MKGLAGAIILLILVVGGGYFTIAQYSWIFAARVEGTVLEVARVTDPTAIIGRVSNEQMFSFSLMIKDKEGQIFTASTEDRQWQVIKKGCEVQATLYRYPFWNLDKGGTFFNARVTKVLNCPEVPATESHSNPPSETTK
jgi:hypothetical protein